MHEQIPAARPLSLERERGVYQLRAGDGLAHVMVEIGSDSTRQARTQHALQALAAANIPIFLIKLHSTSLSFAVREELLARVEECLNSIAAHCITRPNLALITVVATSMRDQNNVMVTIADALQNAGARMYGIGDSHNTVQCLVEAATLESAVRELAIAFRLDPVTAVLWEADPVDD